MEVVSSLPGIPIIGVQQVGVQGHLLPGTGAHRLPVLWSSVAAEVVVTGFHFAEIQKGK